MIIWLGFRQSLPCINVYLSVTKSKPLDMTFSRLRFAVHINSVCMQVIREYLYTSALNICYYMYMQMYMIQIIHKKSIYKTEQDKDRPAVKSLR